MIIAVRHSVGVAESLYMLLNFVLACQVEQLYTSSGTLHRDTIKEALSIDKHKEGLRRCRPYHVIAVYMRVKAKPSRNTEQINVQSDY